MSKRLSARPVILSLLPIVALALAAPAFAAGDAGRAAIGGSLGAMKFLSGDDFGEGSVRPIWQGIAKYNFTPRWAGVIESGWGWNAYANEIEGVDDSLATVVPTTFGLEYRNRYGESKIWSHAAAGLGLYSLGIKDSYRSWAETPNGKRLTWTKPGLYGKVGGEYLFDNGASIGMDLLYHMIFANNEDELPGRWADQNTSFAEFRIVGSYYFRVKGYGGTEAEKPKETGSSDKE